MTLGQPVKLTGGLLTFTIDGTEDRVLTAGTQITVLPDSQELECHICKIEVDDRSLWVTAEDLAASVS